MILLTDGNQCMNSIETGDEFSYETSDPNSCPIVQTLTLTSNAEGQVFEDFNRDTGSFRVRPDS